MPARLSLVTKLRYKAGVTREIPPNEIRLLQTLAGAAQGGAEMHFVRLAEALARAGVRQQVVMRGHPKALARLEAAGIPVIRARFGGPLDLATRWRIRQALARFRPQVALSYMNRATKFTPRGRHVLVARLGGYYDLKYYRHCDHLVGNTPDLVAYFAREGWPAGKATMIPNFVETRPGGALARASLATPEGVPLLVAVGRLHRNKAFDTLLRAAALIPGAHVWIVGEGPERPALEALAEQLGLRERLRLPGWQDDVLPAIRAADVYVVPSRHEPFGSVVLDGWMAGTPLVATESQGPGWLITQGESGLLVPVDAPEALAASIGALLADPDLGARLAAEGRRLLEQTYSEAAAVKGYLGLFRRLIAEQKDAKR